LGGLQPRHAKLLLGDGPAGDVSIHHRLIAPVAAFDDNVVDDSLKARVAIQLRAERRALLIAMIAFAERHDIVRFERIDNAVYRI
jgi:hypothetical protein